MTQTNPAPGDDATEADSSELLGDELVELGRVLESARQSAKELRQSAVRARLANEQALASFFERCAVADEARVLEAKHLLEARSGPPSAEQVTSADQAAGDGATDADVSPDSTRGVPSA